LQTVYLYQDDPRLGGGLNLGVVSKFLNQRSSNGSFLDSSD
jgi:hypothetical protein